MENLFGLEFSTGEINDPPKPLIFKVDKVQEKTSVNINQYYYYYYDIYGGDSILEYCEVTGTGCIFKELTNISFEKGKTYKIKLSCYKNKNNDLFIFKKFEVSSFIKELEFLPNIYRTNNNKINYFIINIKKYN